LVKKRDRKGKNEEKKEKKGKKGRKGKKGKKKADENGPWQLQNYTFRDIFQILWFGFLVCIIVYTL